MRYLFPVKRLLQFSRNNKNWTYCVFFLCLIFSITKGYLTKEKQNPYALIYFFDHWTGWSKNVFDEIIKVLYTPFGIVIWLLLVFLLFLWVLYRCSRLKMLSRFIDFIFPFVSLCYFGAFLSVLSFFLALFSIQIPYIIRLAIFLYWLIFYILILIKEFDLKPVRSTICVLVSFLLGFILGGFPSIAPYFQWL